MRRFSIVLTILLIALIFPFSVFAQNNFSSRDNVILPSNQTIDKDYFASGKSILLDGTVNGDAYLAGGDVNLNGTVNGDLLAAGGNININGLVTGNIRAAGGNITINGKVGRNVTVAGGSIVVTPNAQIDGSLTSAGGNLSFLSPIGKDANIAGGQVNIGSTVGGDIAAAVGQLTLSPLAKVKGNVTYWGENKANISPMASVSGKITQNIPPKERQQKVYNAGKTDATGIITTLKIFSFLTALIIGFILLKLFPIYTGNVTRKIQEDMLPSLGVGFLSLAATPFLIILLLVTIVGIPLAFLWVFLLISGLWLSKIFVSLVIGGTIANYLKQKWSIYLIFLLGLIVYFVVEMIPVVGWLFSCLAGITTFGAIILTTKGYLFNTNKIKPKR